MGLPRLVTLLCFKRFKYTVHIEQLQYNTIVKKCKHKYKHKYNQLLGLPRLVTLLCCKRFKYTVVFTVQTKYKCNHKQKCKHKYNQLVGLPRLVTLLCNNPFAV